MNKMKGYHQVYSRYGKDFKRFPWIFNCSTGEIHAFFFAFMEKRSLNNSSYGYGPKYNAYLQYDKSGLLFKRKQFIRLMV